jgi:hypothetical protein
MVIIQVHTLITLPMKATGNFLARIDWNINNANKLSLRYNYTKNQGWNPTNGNSTDAGFRNRQ